MPRLRPLAFATAAIALAALSGCARDGEFPSLAPRAIEREDPLEEPVRTPPTVPSQPALRARAAELLAGAREGDRAFQTEIGAAEAAVRRAGGVGSDSWIVAQQMISRAEAARAPTTRAVAELDRLATERAAIDTNLQDFAAIQAAREEATRIASSQQRLLDPLRASLSR